MKEIKCYTIGHSNHKIEKFKKLVIKYKIDFIIDVRSIPYSKYNSQYNKEYLRKELNKEGIKYIHFKKEFGAKKEKDELLFEDGKVNFKKVRKTKEFKKGVKRVKKGIKKGLNLCLMCSEKNP